MMKRHLNFCLFLMVLVIMALDGVGQTAGPSRFDSAWTEYFRRNSGGWTAGDATISIPLPDGRVIWLFGDSYTVAVNMANNTLPCLFQVRNCFMVQDSVDRSVFRTILDTTMTGINMTTFKLRPNDTSLFWPGHGYVYQDTVYIFLERYKSSTLKYEGCYIAKLTYPDLHQVALVPALYAGPNLIFGRAIVPDTADNRIYIYGNKLNWIVQEPVVARGNISNPLLPWEYFTGTAWSSDPGLVQKIGNDPVSPGFSVFAKDGKYYLVTQENGYLECGLGREIWSYNSSHPWGPFTGKTLLYTEESQFNGQYLLTYNAQAHPWNMDNGELLVCYNVNDRVDTLAPYICPSQCKHIWTDRLDADSYRPKFVRVPMGLITSGDGDAKGWLPEALGVKILQHPVSRNGMIELEITPSKPWIGQVTLSSPYGRLIWCRPLMLPQGRNHLQLAAPLSAGLYFLEFIGKTGCRSVVKVVVK